MARQSSAVPLELAGEKAFPPGDLLVPGVQDLLLLHRGHGQAVGVGLLDVGPHSRQTGGILHLPAHDAHQQVVQGVVIHEVAAPPRFVRNGTVFAFVDGAKQKPRFVCGKRCLDVVVQGDCNVQRV